MFASLKDSLDGQPQLTSQEGGVSVQDVQNEFRGHHYTQKSSIWEMFLVFMILQYWSWTQSNLIFCSGYFWSLELSSTKPEVLFMSKTVPSPRSYPACLWSAISIHVEPNPASATHVVAIRDPAKNSMNWKSSGPEGIPRLIDPFNIND